MENRELIVIAHQQLAHGVKTLLQLQMENTSDENRFAINDVIKTFQNFEKVIVADLPPTL
jgi:hypothetical protein